MGFVRTLTANAPNAAAASPPTASNQKWLAVATITAMTSATYSTAPARSARERTSAKTVPAATAANATCPLGIAAYGLCTECASASPPVPYTAASVSVKPSSGAIRGGATGHSR